MRETYLGWLGQALVVILISAVISVTHAGALPTSNTFIADTTPLTEETKS